MVIVTTLGAVGASPIPNAGLVIIVSMWEAVFPGIPMPSQISWIMSIDWLLDRCETTGALPYCVQGFTAVDSIFFFPVNVFGDSIGAAVVDHLLRESGDIDSLTTSEQTGSDSLEFQNIRAEQIPDPSEEAAPMEKDVNV